jgi:serine/threonine protein phosphatase PrpC
MNRPSENGSGPEVGSSDAAIGAALRSLLLAAHSVGAYDLPTLARRHVKAFGGSDVQFYLADLQQSVLVPFAGRNGARTDEQLEPLPIESTIAGRVFQHLQPLTRVGQPGGAIVWLPLLDGTERLGVLAIGVDAAEPTELEAAVGRLEVFASVLGELVMTKTQYGDSLVQARRQAPMGLAAELQWSLLPPLTFACDEVTVAAALEPAYEVAGDTFDYAVDPGTAKVAVFDGMGHGLRSAQLAAMAVAAYRHARRAGRSLVETCQDIDTALLETFGGTTFTTALLAELDTKNGVLRWANAGHPEPLLLRGGRLIKSLGAVPRPPLGINLWGTAADPMPAIGREPLEPGDVVLLYTDGVTEARSPDGEFFGEQRLIDLVVRNLAAELPAPETTRRVVRALLDHQQGRLTDDATIALLTWRGAPDLQAI